MIHFKHNLELLNEFPVFICINKCVCVGSPFLLRDSPGVYYRFSPPRVSTSYYYCYTDMRIKAYKGSDYTIQLIVKAAHTAQYRFVVWNVTLCQSPRWQRPNYFHPIPKSIYIQYHIVYSYICYDYRAISIDSSIWLDLF